MAAERGVRCFLVLLTCMLACRPSAAYVETTEDLLNKLEGLLALQCPGETGKHQFTGLQLLKDEIRTCEEKIASHRALRPTGEPIGLEDGRFSTEHVTVSSESPHRPHTLIGLNAPHGSWCAADNDENQWVSVDLQNELLLTGLSLQGSGDPDEQCWILRYRVEISLDGIHWGCVLDSYGQIQYFPGNVDVQSVSIALFTPTLRARYIRIVPKSWHHCICLRLEVYVEELYSTPSGEPIGLENGNFDTSYITVSSQRDLTPVSSIRLNQDLAGGAWCADGNDLFPYVEVDLRLIHSITGIVVQGNSDGVRFVDQFQVETSRDGTTYTYLTNSFGFKKNFQGGPDSTVNIISPHPAARYIRIHIISNHNGACLRLEIYVEELCDRDDLPEGIPVIENGIVNPEDITASSNWPKYLPSRSPLNTLPALPDFGGSWCAAQESTEDTQEWIQMDFGDYAEVTGVVLQGDPTRDFWVSRFSIYFSDDGEVFRFYGFGQPEIFQGSRSRNGYAIVKIYHHETRFIRIVPVNWKDCICLRWEVYILETSDAPPQVTCGPPPGIENGVVTASGDTPGVATAWYDCDDTFVLSGPNDISCDENGIWGQPPTCVQCDPPANPAFGSITYDSLGIGSIATITCFPDHRLPDDASDQAECQIRIDGLSPSFGEIPDCILTCGPPPGIENGTVTASGDTPGVATAWYDCDDTFVLSGPNDILCDENGIWGQPPTCVPDTPSVGDAPPPECNPPRNPQFGTISTDSLVIGSIAIITCNENYRLPDGVLNIVQCQTRTSDPSPSFGEIPECVLTCGLPPGIENGTVTASGDTPGVATAWYDCDDTFVLSGPNDISCDENGIWGQPPTCVLTCGLPPGIENGIVTASGDTPGVATAWYDCTDTFVLSGPNDISCDENGIWGQPPTCVQITCDGNLPTDDNGLYVEDGNSIGSSAHLECTEGYHGESVVTCEVQADGRTAQWSQPQETCIENPTCPPNLSFTPPNKKDSTFDVTWNMDDDVTCYPPPGQFAVGVHNVTCTRGSMSCEFQLTVEDIAPPNFWRCANGKLSEGQTMSLSQRVRGSDNSGKYTITCTRKVDGEPIPYYETREWPSGRTDVVCIIVDDAGLRDMNGPCELTVTVGSPPPQLTCPENIESTLEPGKSEVLVEWAVDNDVSCDHLPYLFSEGEVNVTCYRGFESCHFKITVSASSMCPKVSFPGGTALFENGNIGVENLDAYSSHYNENHGLSHLPLLDPENNHLAWCAGSNPQIGSEYVSIDFGDEIYVSGLVMRGNNHEDFPAWVTAVELTFENEDGISKIAKHFPANTDANCDAVIIFDHPKLMSELKIFPIDWYPSDLLCMRVEVFAFVG